jgi:hypothetical protein
VTQPAGEVRHTFAGDDLLTELVERGFGGEGVGEPLEPVLPRVLAEVVEAGRFTGLADEELGFEPGGHRALVIGRCCHHR